MGSNTTQIEREPDFSGYVTKAGIVCSDGRMIDAKAFEHQDGETVPFVWQHGHKDVENVLGHVKLEKRPDGMYGYVYVNSTAKGQHAKATVNDGDLNSMSIWANELREKIANGIKHVLGGGIKEVSLALAGANSGAKIDNIRVAHSDTPDDEDDPMAIQTLPDEAFIRMGQPLEHAVPSSTPVVEEETPEEAPEGEENADEETPDEEASEAEETPDEEPAEGDAGDEDLEHASVAEAWESMTADQQAAVRVMIGVALEGDNSAQHSEEQDPEGDLIHTQEGTPEMTTRNVFETQNPGKSVSLQHSGLDLEKRWDRPTTQQLLHSAMGDIARPGSGVQSLRKHLTQAAADHLGHDVEYGIENIDYLFPDAEARAGLPGVHHASGRLGRRCSHRRPSLAVQPRQDLLRRHHCRRGSRQGLPEGQPEEGRVVHALEARHHAGHGLQEAEAGPRRHPGHHGHGRCGVDEDRDADDARRGDRARDPRGRRP